jgi:hypothetical protein
MNTEATVQQSAGVSIETPAVPPQSPKPPTRNRPSSKRDEKSVPRDYGNETLLVGFDTEYTSKDGVNNKLLSYQFYACDIRGENEWQGIIHLASGDKSDRKSFRDFFKKVIGDGFSQAKLSRWPKRIIWIGHFTLADLTGFEDFDDFKTEFDAIRRTFITIKEEPTITVYDDNRHAHEIKIFLRDSMLLAPGGSQSLKALGELVQVLKINLAPGIIEKMDELRLNKPKLFDEYALQDPKIAVRYCLKIMALNRELLGENCIPPTLSAIGINFLLRQWQDEGIDAHQVLGTESTTEKTWQQARGRFKTQKKSVPLAIRHEHEAIATECYHGGRGEQYFFGASEVGTWTDYDLSGAYPTAMGLIGMPQWAKLRTSLDVNEYGFDVLGYARIKFKFPAGTLFPCIPVRTEFGLIFPLEGEACCCAPEIALAQSMGAEIEILHGVILPSNVDIRPFESFIIDCTERRKSHPKKSLEELFWKELSNGTYGKTAQGLRRKRRFDSRSGEYDDMPPSKITNPFIAAFVTSYVRSAVGEILSRLPTSALVSNVTTDGLLTTATQAEMDLAISGPICRLYSEERQRIVGEPGVIEKKHQIGRVLGMRTRGQATLVAIPGEAIVLAKAGLKPPGNLKDDAALNDWVVDLFINRTQNSTQTLNLLRTLPEIYNHGGDLARKEITRKVSLEFDFKRRPTGGMERSIKDVPHLYFDTAPWRNADEFAACREARNQYKDRQGGVFKTLADLEGFLDFQAMGVVPGLRRVGKDTSLKTARRMFLRAYVRSEWGLDASAASYAELAKWLHELGYRTQKEDVENARRPSAKLIARVVPRSPVIENFIARIREKFPNFQGEMLLKQAAGVESEINPTEQ